MTRQMREGDLTDKAEAWVSSGVVMRPGILIDGRYVGLG
jgi:hypothetical protein